MRPLRLLPGKNATSAATAFNTVLDAAYIRASQNGKTQNEPNFVRELISDKTIIDLNSAASNIYDENINSVRFAGGFIHGQPYAEFTAINGGVSTVCTRELADAVVVLNETQPNGQGLHSVVRRAACLLMFKTKDANKPKCLKYDASGASPPKGTDQEQFHLFSAWPSFELLHSSGTTIGKYSIGQPASNPNRCSHGKFAVLWSPTSKKICGWGHRWRYADPEPSAAITNSMGLLLSKIADADSNHGRTYDLGGTDPWDKLIVDLHSYAGSYKWGGQSRSANPAGLSFLQAQEFIDTSLGTISQHIRNAVIMGKEMWPDWPYLLEDIYCSFFDRPRRELPVPEGSIPILSITVSSFQLPENSEPIDPDTRIKLIRNAARGLRDVLRRGN